MKVLIRAVVIDGGTSDNIVSQALVDRVLLRVKNIQDLILFDG